MQNEAVKKLLREIEHLVSLIETNDIDEFIQRICLAKRVFVIGSGRSGILVKAFAMRLMQMGFTVHVIGETTTPASNKHDLLIVISASGVTCYPLDILKTAKKLGMHTLLITANPDSEMAKLAEQKLVIPASTKVSPGKISTEQISASLFEQAVFILLEYLVHVMVKKLKITESEIRTRHANLE